MTPTQIRIILSSISFRDWRFILLQEGERMMLQVSFIERCIVTQEMTEQKGRKWLLSEHMTRGEVVQTAFKAVLTALEHEAREAFTYRDQLIFGPHFDVDALADLAAKSATEHRTPPLTQEAV